MAAVVCWHLGKTSAHAVDPPPQPAWTYSTLREKLENPLKDENRAPKNLEEMGFFGGPAHYPVEAFFGGSQITTPVTEALRFLRYDNYKGSRQAVTDYVRNHQPRTFGVELIGALLERDASPKVRKFILDRGKEFTQLPPASAWGVLIVLREAMPGVDDPETEASLRATLLPLKDQEDKQVAAMTEKFFEVKNWAQAGSNFHEYISLTVELLRLLGKRDPLETRHAFDHGFGVVRDGIRAEVQKDPANRFTEQENLAHWYRECSTVPVLLPVVMRLSAEEPALRDYKELDYQIASWSTRSQRMADPAYVRDMFETLPFLKDAGEFRAFKMQGQGKGTLLGEAAERLSNYSDARSGRDGLRAHISKMKHPTFGSDLTLAMMQNGRKDAGVLAFIKKHAAEMSQLSPEGREEMAILVRNEVPDFFKPGVLDPELRKAAAPILGTDQKLNNQRVADIMAAMDIAATRLSEADFNIQAPVLLQTLADTDLPAARKFLTKVTQLILDSESQQHSDRPAAYSPVGVWLRNTHSSPQLYPEVMAEAKKLDLLQVDEDDWFVRYTQELTARDNLTDAPRITDFLEASPLLREAADFDPLSVVNRQSYFHSVAEMLAYTLRSPFTEKKMLPAIREYLAKRSPHTFGSDFLLALTDDDPIGATAAFAMAHEADWQKIPAGPRRLALAGLYRPMIARMEVARHPNTAEVKRALQPLLEEEAKQQRKFLEQLMQAQSLDEFGKSYLFHRPLIWLLEWMQSTGEGDAPAALAKACKLYQDGAKNAVNWDKKPSSSAMARLLRELAYSPRLQTLYLNEAAAWNLREDAAFLREAHHALFHIDVFWIGQTHIAAGLRTSPFLNDARHFDAWLYENPMPNSELESLVSYLRSPWRPYLRLQTQVWLEKEPSGFGRDLLLAAMDETPKEKISDFLKAHADDLSKLSAEQRNAIKRLSERLMAVKKK